MIIKYPFTSQSHLIFVFYLQSACQGGGTKKTLIFLAKSDLDQHPYRCKNEKGLPELHTMYWNRFQVVHFYTVLPTDPHVQLRFPEKFVKNLKEALQDTVELKGPSGQTWNVGLMRNGDDLFLQIGWEEFANAHSLKEGEVLFFRYNGDSRFDVLTFDQSNYCEKASAYFVKKCNCNEEMNEPRRTEREPSLEIIDRTRSKKKPQREVIDVEILQLPPSGGGKSTSAGERNLVGPTTALSIIAVEPKLEEVSSEGETYEDIKGAHQYVSRRRPFTKEEMTRAHDLAVAAGARSDKVHFLVVMKKTHISSTFNMVIPTETAKRYFPRENAVVTLKFEGENWPVTYYHYKHNSGIRGSGWVNFVSDNNLDLGDVCLFELLPRKQATVVMNVHIFRVVKEVVPLKKVADSGKKRIKRLL